MQDNDKQALKEAAQREKERQNEAEEWFRKEQLWIDANNESNKSRRFSLALSGGGVRAAAVARGLIDALSQRSLIKQLDYVSSVSGGGYASGELVQRPLDTNKKAKAWRRNRTDAPAYSSWMALWWGTLEVLLRLWLAVTPAAGLMMLILPSVLNDFWLAIPLLLALCLLFLIGRQEWWARRLQRLFFGSFVVFTLVSLVGLVGLTAVSLVMGGLLVWAWLYVRVMPHRTATLREIQHWPKMVMLSLSVAAAVLVARKVGLFAHPYWIAIALIIWAVSALVYVVILHRNINAAQPLFSYYRNRLSHAYLTDPQVPLKNTTPPAPFPIFNVTANAGEQEFQMEISPLSIGPMNGMRLPTPAGISMADAVASSASALDFTRQGWSINAALSFVLGGTGYWLPKAPQGIDLGRLMRAAFNMPGNGTIRLADGGFTDNLGLMALLRRNTARIMCLDAAYDPKFQFEDLRRVCHAAAIEGAGNIDTRDLQEFSDALRFAQIRRCFIKLSVNYPNGLKGEIWLIKLHDHKANLREKYFDYPHITTSDQQLLPDELQALRSLGKRLSDAELAWQAPVHLDAVLPGTVEGSSRRRGRRLSLVAEVSSYLNRSPLEIEDLLDATKEGTEELVAVTNEFNELLYDEIIPRLFRQLYDLDESQQTEEHEVDLIKVPSSGYYEVSAAKDKIVRMTNEQIKDDERAKSFHLDTYCFDSGSENWLFWDLLREQRVKKIYFTGMLTHGQSDFFIQYIDPDSRTVRSYYPDFIFQREEPDGSLKYVIVEVKADNQIDDAVVQAKKEFANQIAVASGMEYRLMKSSDADNRHYRVLL